MDAALILADTDLPPRHLLDRYARGARWIIAADGGADRAVEAGLRVDHVIGDLDGITPRTRRELGRKVHRDADPDHTDLEKAVAFAHGKGARRVVLAGVIGGRLDHTVASLSVASAWADRLDILVLDPHFATRPVTKRRSIPGPVGTVVSVLAPGGAMGVTTVGLRFPLKDADLPFSPLGVHNEVVRRPASVSVKRGVLLVMESHAPRPDF